MSGLVVDCYDSNPFVNTCPYDINIESKSVDSVSKFLSTLISGKFWGGVSVNGDLNWAIRTTCVDLTSALGYPVDKSGIFYHLMGITTIFNLFAGTFNTLKTGSQVTQALSLDDKQGMIAEGLSFASSVAQTLGGAAMLLFRPASLFLEVVQPKGAVSLKHATLRLGQAASAIFGVFYALLGLSSLCHLYQLLKFRCQYTLEKDKVTFLRNQLDLTPQEQRKLKNCSDAKLEKMKLKHEVQLERIIGGSSTMQRLKRCYSFSSKKKKDALIAKVERAWLTNTLVHSLYVLSGFTGCVTTIAGFVFTGNVGAIAIASVWIFAVILPMMAADAYNYYADLQNTPPGRYDKHLLILNSIVALMVTGGTVVFTSIFSFGVVPIVLTLVLGALWLAINGISYANILNYEKSHRTLTVS
jgi:hypothetical protein